MLNNMSKKKRRGFTLIELVAVLVIMAILALIVTPLVMNIIRKARISADKRSIDAYGRSIELAIASYLLDTGKFPTSVDQLTIEYSGNEVVCSTTQINSDSSVYLTGCKVKNRNVEGYKYGKYEAPTYDTYSIGDHISYNGVTYYVIEDSSTTNDTVKLLKETPLLKTEIEGYNIDGLTVSGSTYGEIQYGSSTDYETSAVKKVVDKWAEGAVKSGDTAIARLISVDELTNNLGYVYDDINPTNIFYVSTESTPIWVYNILGYWTMSPFLDSLYIWRVDYDGRHIREFDPSIAISTVRPVLEISKTAELTKIAS